MASPIVVDTQITSNFLWRAMDAAFVGTWVIDIIMFAIMTHTFHVHNEDAYAYFIGSIMCFAISRILLVLIFALRVGLGRDCCGWLGILFPELAWFSLGFSVHNDRDDNNKYALLIPKFGIDTEEATTIFMQQLANKLVFYGGFLLHFLLFTLPTFVLKLHALNAWSNNTKIPTFTLKISILLSMLHFCVMTLFAAYKFSLSLHALVFNWSCSAADMFMFLCQVIFVCVYSHPAMITLLFYSSLIGVLPMSIALVVQLVMQNNRRIPDGGHGCCGCMTYIMLMFAPFLMLIVLQCACFIHLEYVVFVTGYDRLPTSRYVWQFYHRVYEWVVLSAKAYDADILDISREQDRAIRLGIFHKHCSYFIPASEFKTFVITKGEETGFLDIDEAQFKRGFWGSVWRLCTLPVVENEKSSKDPAQASPGCFEIWSAYCLCYAVIPLYAATRVLHVLWPLILLGVVTASEISRFEIVLCALYFVCMVPVLPSYAVFARFDRFHHFLSHIFSILDELPSMYLSWQYFSSIPKVYELTLLIPARNALLTDVFGPDITRIVLQYLTALDEGMPRRPGG